MGPILTKLLRTTLKKAQFVAKEVLKGQFRTAITSTNSEYACK